MRADPPRPPRAASRGDPVDVMGGRSFVDAEPDLALPGPLPFVLARSYSSDRAMVDVGFGHGWSHSFAWSARVGRRAVEVTDAEGAQLLLPLPGIGEALLGAEGWVVRRGAEERLELVREDGLRLVLDAPLGDGKLALSAVLDRYNNRISLIYERGILVAFEDSAGRAILVRRDGRGRIAALEVPSQDGFSSGSPVVRYSYTTAGDLAEVVEPDGFVTSFDYEDHRITKHRYPGGMVFHYRYDAQGRCVETWGAPETGVDPCLDPDLPAYNRYRYYDPRIGRYLSPDPLGVHGGLNVFSYADNDPSTHVDPDGLLPMAVITQPGRPDIVGRSGQVPQRGDPGFDPAVGYAHYNARVALGGGPGRQAGNEGCAEISALHQMAQQIRADNPNRRMSRAEVRREMQRRFRNGARISTNNGMNGGGPAMCPCHMCAQTFRELGLHPGNINQGAAANATGGVAAPNPGRGNNRGLWDGQSIWRSNRNENTSRQENDAANGLIGATQPSRTPPFTGT
ncbi:DUF6531 domain-containing protein [Sorangium sp. So ce542]|uniref:DUF6531 domain-containing protein n=1 Tax=Sorangium sp. So ce542 TaxID=3133316 RepID=UPI003F5D8734